MRSVIGSIICICTFMCVSCNGTIGKEQSKSKQSSASFKMVVANIDSMGAASWNKSEYLNIKNNQIPLLKRDIEKKSASELLSTTYGKVLVRDANAILNNGCIQHQAHVQLEKLFSELSGFTDAQGYKELAQLKTIHDEAFRFANSGVGRQFVRSYRDFYDTSFEKNHIAKAESFLDNSSVKCKETRDKLKRLSTVSGYDSRRRNYCESIVSLYLQCSNPAKSEFNAALAKLNIYKGDKEAWKSRMKDHFDDIQPKKDEI